VKYQCVGNIVGSSAAQRVMLSNNA